MYQPRPAHTHVTQINTKSIVPIVSVRLPSALTVEKLEKKTVISKKTCIMDWLVFISLRFLLNYFRLFLLQLCKLMDTGRRIFWLMNAREHGRKKRGEKKKRKEEEKRLA